LGLDLVGGSQLNYEADVSKLPSNEIDGAMESLKETLSRKLNSSGTSEVSIVVERPSIFSNKDDENSRVVNISIPGVSDIEEAKKMVGQTPTLDFKIKTENGYEDTGLTGRQLKDANLTRDQLGQPAVLIRFDDEGTKLFADLTNNHIGEQMGIFIDNVPISEPVLRAKISDGVSIIEGNFTLEEATTLTRNLKFGALPVPIKLVSSNSVSPSLGDEVLKAGVKSALIGLALVALFLIFFYRLAGFVATLALTSYVILTLALFKLLGFVFTAAGIAGFIISIGMAVDANILIFERIKEELRAGRAMRESIENGFKRAWLSIRDGNLSSILTAIILFYMTTALVKGFSLTFGFGVIVSMFTAIVLTRTFLLAMAGNSNKNKLKKLFFGVNK
jgi:protein-export SecD/SecF family membrane protein